MEQFNKVTAELRTQKDLEKFRDICKEQGQKQFIDMREYFFRLPAEYFDENREKYIEAYQLFKEDFSRQVYLAKVRRAFLMSDIAEVVSPWEEMYFDEKVKLTDEEVFIDCGGFDGDSSVAFLEKCKGKYKDIFILRQCRQMLPMFQKRKVSM